MQKQNKGHIITGMKLGKNRSLPILLLLLLLVLFSSSIPAIRAEDPADVDASREKLWDITKALRDKRQQLELIKQKQNQTLRNLTIINRQIQSTQHELNYAEAQLRRKEDQLKKNQQELLGLKESSIVRKDLFQKRVREIYKENRLGYLVILFTAQTMGDFMNRVFYFEKLLQADARLLAQLSQQQRLIEQKENQLQRRYSEISDIKKLFQQKRSIFRQQQVYQNRIYQDIAKKRQQYERQIAELEKNSKEIEDLIVRLMAQGKTSAVKGTGRFLWPLRGKLTSYYGYRRHPIFRSVRFHSGIDIGTRYGSRIRSADTGQVIFAGWWGGYGRAVIIDHGNGYSTVYAHLSSIFVNKDQYVNQGQVLGAAGSTGYATGPHLHFEIRKFGKTYDPLRFL